MGKRFKQKSILSYMPKPFFDEALDSWLYRGGLECGLKPAHLIAAMEDDFPNQVGLIRTDVQKDVVTAVRLLRDMTGYPMYILNPLFLPSRYAGANNLKNLDRSHGWPEFKNHQHWILSSRGTVYCPMCLQTDDKPYFRRVWRTMVSLACPVHGIRLLDQCPHCGISIQKHYVRDHTGDQTMCSQCYESLCSVTHGLVEYNNSTIQILTDVVLGDNFYVRPYTKYRDGRVDGMSFSTVFLDWVLHMPIMAINSFLPNDERLTDRTLWRQCGVVDRALYVSSFHRYLSLSLHDRVSIFKRFPPSILSTVENVLRIHGSIPKTFTLLDSLYSGDTIPSTHQQFISLMDENVDLYPKDDMDYLEYVFYNSWYQNPLFSRMEYLGHTESLHLAIDLCHKKHTLVCENANLTKPRLTKALSRNMSYECPSCHKFFATTSSRTYFQPPNMYRGLYE